MTEQITDTTKVQHGKPASFIGVTYRNMGGMFLTRSELSQRHIYHLSPPKHGSSQKLELWACSVL